MQQKYKFLCLSVLIALQAQAYADQKIDLPTTPVTANPLGVSSDEFIVPISVLNGHDLDIKRNNSFAETLDGTPGVSFSNWGPSIGRPVIRGMSADRIRIMQNGINSLDVSSFSSDHAVAIDPLVIEQIDIIRGPATVLYGGGTVGGVVNAIDHRIPRQKITGATGRAVTRFGGANSERSSAVVGDVGFGNFVIHLDAYTRKTGNLSIPGYSVSGKLARSDSEISRNQYGKKGQLRNSGSDIDGGAVGASYFFEKGYVGMSYAKHESETGNPLTATGFFDLETNRWDLHSEFHDLDGFFNHFKFKMAHTDYKHDEHHEPGEIENTFKNRGLDGTLELGHHAIAGMSGVVGLHFENSSFKQPNGVLLPNANTDSQSVYVYEELPINEHKLTLGFRRGNHDVKRNSFTGDGGCSISYTDLVDCSASGGSEDDQSFGETEKTFQTNNAAIGGVYKINQNWSLNSNVAHSERAPAFFELFPYGAHHATAQVHKGNENLNTELSNTIDFQIKWKNNGHAFSVGPYYTKFNRFIGIFNTGNELYHLHEGEDEAEGMSVFQYRSVGATFKGLEFDGNYQINDQFDFSYKGDYVRAEQDNGDDLPRISPLRLGAGIAYEKNNFYARLDILRAFAQDNIATHELKTDAYTNVTAYASYQLPVEYNLQLFLKGHNLLDQEIRDHSSFMKDKFLRGGRSVLFGLQGEF
ncbi:MAG: TonB-dependent receptor [Methylophilaceae bacterium]